MQCSGQAALTEASDCGSIFVSQVNVNASSDCNFIDCDSSVYKGLEISSKFKPLKFLNLIISGIFVAK